MTRSQGFEAKQEKFLQEQFERELERENLSRQMAIDATKLEQLMWERRLKAKCDAWLLRFALRRTKNPFIRRQLQERMQRTTVDARNDNATRLAEFNYYYSARASELGFDGAGIAALSTPSHLHEVAAHELDRSGRVNIRNIEETLSKYHSSSDNYRAAVSAVTKMHINQWRADGAVKSTFGKLYLSESQARYFKKIQERSTKRPDSLREWYRGREVARFKALDKRISALHNTVSKGFINESAYRKKLNEEIDRTSTELRMLNENYGKKAAFLAARGGRGWLPTEIGASHQHAAFQRDRLDSLRDELMKKKGGSDGVTPLLIMEKHKGLGARVDIEPDSVKEARGQHLKRVIADSTNVEYSRIAAAWSELPVEQWPSRLSERAQELSRSSWWKNHAVTRRLICAAESQEAKRGNVENGAALREVRATIERMQYRDYSQGPTRAPVPQKNIVPEHVYHQILTEARGGTDMDLHDAVILARETGIRPDELHRGVVLRRIDDDLVEVQIYGSKKQIGKKGGSRFNAKKGGDRALVVASSDLVEIVKRRGGHLPLGAEVKWRPGSTKDALRRRLSRLDAAKDHEVTFYSFRHQARTEMAAGNVPKWRIAVAMGHSSQATQGIYGSGSSVMGVSSTRIISARGIK